ncbi:type IV pilus modification PilV family protein [Vreelandella nanhaiensis]|uniref:Pilus assembly protein PilV n=1 Tax=Vreelandella nanhaiensis TaxID=1258546 RepID=A0A433KTJ1_9GAMM|nr:prepilin-type N-terminal cleavage/methylation domain-containing protein [Halomonas nanhaiensis]RUR33009.1 pilus assembly protein PilV [Halomonas nanhaiensis]
MPRQAGFSLVEALIALALLAFGLIGIAAMQLASLQGAAAGFQRSVASLAAIDAQERAWARLSSAQSCRRIDLAALERDWQAQWLEDAHAPLGDAVGTISRTVVNDSCQLTVAIVVKARASENAEERFDYVFTLPAWEET